MRLIYKIAKIIYIQLEDPAEVDYFKIKDLRFFRKFGVTDYRTFFKMWLRRFPKPVLIVAVSGREIVGFVYIEEWKEGMAKDGQPVYTLRSIELTDEMKRKKIGANLVYLSMAIVPGHIITKPIDERAESFFEYMGFKRPKNVKNPPIDMSRKQDHFILTVYRKEGTLKEKGIPRAVPSMSSIFKVRVDTVKQAEDITSELERQLEFYSSLTEEMKLETAPGRANDGLPAKESSGQEGGKPTKSNGKDALVPIALVYYKGHSLHYHKESGSLESPNRIESVYKHLKDREKVFQKDCELFTDFEPASPHQLEMCHTKSYVKRIKRYCETGGGVMGPDIFFTPETFEVASYAVGGTIKAVDLVVKEGYTYSLALIRPPGHHASEDKFGGFCIFNNSAIAARHLIRETGMKKVAIVDWDAHAANGTQDIFYDDPHVMLVSVHQDPANIYPHLGFIREVGEGKGKGYNINIPMPVHSGDNEYKLVVEEIVMPLLRSYQPDFVIGVNGFDAYWNEPTTKLNLTTEGYHTIVSSISSEYKGKFSIIIEGGYHKKNGLLAMVILEALKGKKNSRKERFGSVLRPGEKDRIKLGKDVRIILNKVKKTLKPYIKF